MKHQTTAFKSAKCREVSSGATLGRFEGFFILEKMRTKGSCRFAAYYKVQFWNEKQMAWQDVQKQFATPEDAKAQFVTGKKCRVMEVTTKGRNPLP